MKWMCVNGLFKDSQFTSKNGLKPVRLPHNSLGNRPRNGRRRVQYFYFSIYAFVYFIIIFEV